MLKCKIIDFFASAIPLKRWQHFLIRHHTERCPDCLKKLASEDEVKSLLIQENGVGDLEGMWPAVKMKMRQSGERFRLRGRWRWVYSAAALLVIIAGLIWIYFASVPPPDISEEMTGDGFKINYIKVDDKPARAYVFRPQDSNMFIVWVEKES